MQPLLEKPKDSKVRFEIEGPSGTYVATPAGKTIEYPLIQVGPNDMKRLRNDARHLGDH